MRKKISIKGARQHNLKNISLDIPRDKFVVFTGVSGSGKSSIAFDVIYSEGRRRLMESLSSYERGSMGKIAEADVDLIDGLSPAIAIDQKTISRNSRSTVGTLTDLYNYTRLLFSRGSYGECPNCHEHIPVLNRTKIMDLLMENFEGVEIEVSAPRHLVSHESNFYIFDELEKKKYSTVYYEGEKVSINDARVRFDELLNKKKEQKETYLNNNQNVQESYKLIEVCEGKVAISKRNIKKVKSIVEKGLEVGNGVIRIRNAHDDLEIIKKIGCCSCGIIISQVSASAFSSNTPVGACPTCTGVGKYYFVDPDLIISDKSKSIAQGAINLIGWQYYPDKFFKNKKIFEGLANAYNFDLNTPVNELPKNVLDIILYGTKGEKILIENPSAGGKPMKEKFIGIVNIVSERFNSNTKREKNTISEEDKRVVRKLVCPTCLGKKLKLSRQLYRVKDKSIFDFSNMTLYELSEFCKALIKTPANELENSDVVYQVIPSILARVELMNDLGLGYLAMNRPVTMLSGGESQRLKLTKQLSSELMGMIYILDEPSAGLHAKDNDKMINIFHNLRDIGNTVLVVEHDDEIITQADFIVDVGPNAGELGGQIVAKGTVEEIKQNSRSLTGQYLAGHKKIEVPKRRGDASNYLEIIGARKNNLKNINVRIPLRRFVGVTGVSGSGKSTLVNDVLYEKLLSKLKGKETDFEGDVILKGYEHVNNVIHIDQQEIGRTSRSNPATYIGVFDSIRKIFADIEEAKRAKLKKSHFSFNMADGQCQYCKGLGITKIEMQFMADIETVCEACQGKRYNEGVLEIKYKGKNIFDVLDMSMSEAKNFFVDHPDIYEKLNLMEEMGLGYLKLGQSATSLSGGEAQRIKLGKELDNIKGKCDNLYILDEPTTGLHIDDVQRLIGIFQRIVDAGNSVIIIEHNMHIIKTLDYIIDLGPDGGECGGEIVATGTPENITDFKSSYTGQYLYKILHGEKER